jgi:hypothetical protein
MNVELEEVHRSVLDPAKWLVEHTTRPARDVPVILPERLTPRFCEPFTGSGALCLAITFENHWLCVLQVIHYGKYVLLTFYR